MLEVIDLRACALFGHRDSPEGIAELLYDTIERMIKEEDEDIDWFLDKFNDKVIANEKAFYKKAGM